MLGRSMHLLLSYFRFYVEFYAALFIVMQKALMVLMCLTSISEWFFNSY
jgi:hypothetical protein